MTTKLAAQLQVLEVANKATNKTKPSTRPSLLYHPSEAAEADARKIFEDGCRGLDDLARVDGRFRTYKKSLFDMTNMRFDRELETKAENEKLDRLVSGFLRLLSGYILLPAAHLAIEYLIRRYKVEVYNVEDMVLCSLPNHETSLFVRIVHLLHLKNTRWYFLEGLKDTGGPPPREWLVKRFATDMSVVEALCDWAISTSKLGFKTKNVTSFIFVVLVETLVEAREVSSELVSRIQPLLLYSLERNVDEDYRDGAMMIIGALANRTAMSSSFLETLFDLIARALSKSLKRDGGSTHKLQIMVLMQLVQTQDLEKFPSKAFKILVKSREFLTILTELMKVFSAEKFFKLYIQALLDHCLLNEKYEMALVHAVDTVPLNHDQVEILVTKLFDLWRGNGEDTVSSEMRSFVQRVLGAVGRRYAVILDKISRRFLKNISVSDEDQQDDAGYKLVADIFQNSLHYPIAETKKSLYLSLDDPKVEVRELALKKMAELVADSAPDEQGEIKACLRETCLRYLSDVNSDLKLSVLSSNYLVKAVPPERLLESLSSLLAECSKKMIAETFGEDVSLPPLGLMVLFICTMSQGAESIWDQVRNVSKAATDVLASTFVLEHPSFTERVGLVFMNYLLQQWETERLNKYVLQAAMKLPFSLFKGLSETLEEKDITRPKGKRSQQKEHLAKVNDKIVKSLVARVSSDPASLSFLLQSSGMGDNSKLLTVLVLIRCFNEHTEDISFQSLEASLLWLRDEWTTVGSENVFSTPALQKIDYSESADYIHLASEVKSSAAYSELLLRALYGFIACVPMNKDLNLANEGEIGEDMKDELFVLLAGSSSVNIFTPHMELLLSRLPSSVRFTFLSKFFVCEGSAVPAFVQLNSLGMLASQLSNYSQKSMKQLRRLLCPLLVALSSPLKAVRKNAAKCCEYLVSNWEKLGPKGEEEDMNAEGRSLDSLAFRDIGNALVAAKDMFSASGTYLGQFLSEKFGPVKQSTTDVVMKDSRDVRHEAVATFLLKETLRLPVYAQRVLFAALRGIAHGSELVVATQERLTGLLQRRQLCHLQSEPETELKRLRDSEVELLEVLVQYYIPEVVASEEDVIPAFLQCLQIEGGSLLDRAVVQPCFSALKCVTAEFYGALSTPSKDLVFQSLVTLLTVDNELLRSTSSAQLRAITVDAKTVARHIEYILGEELRTELGSRRKKKSKMMEAPLSKGKAWPAKEHLESSASSILEFLLWKENMAGRHVLISPLCKLLRSINSGVWPCSSIEKEMSVTEKEDSGQARKVMDIQHLVLIILDRVAQDLVTGAAKLEDITGQAGFDVDSVVTAVYKATDPATRNYALALVTTLGKLIPQAVLKHMIDILGVVGESAITQDDNYSHEVVTKMLTAVVPLWLAAEKDPTTVLQVFVSSLPSVPAHRRITLVTDLLRVSGVEESLHIFIYLLLRQAGAKDSLERQFASALCRHFPLEMRVPAFVKLLRLVRVDELGGKSSRKTGWALQQTFTQFVASHLRSSQYSAEADASEHMQTSYVALLEQVLLQLQTLGKSKSVSSSLKKECEEAACALLDCLTQVMTSQNYIKGISFLLTHSDASIRRKALRMYTARLKEQELPKRSKLRKNKKAEEGSVSKEGLSDEELEIRVGIIKSITEILAAPREEESMSAKIAAIEALDISALKFGTETPETFTAALSVLIRSFQLENRTLLAASVRCVSSILAQLGPLALPALPDTMMGLFRVVDEMLGQPEKPVRKTDEQDTGTAGQEQSDLLLAVLLCIETLLDKLGSFLTPYLQKMVGLVVLQPSLVKGAVPEVSRKAENVRLLIPTKLPARLLLEPIMSVYEKAVEAGEESTCALFDMLGAMTSKLDRPAVAAYHVKIFDFCLAAFDLRRKSLLPNVSRVESSVVSAIVSLVMKLSETSFKPLFVKVLEWAESEEPTEERVAGKSVDRNIIFYKFVNQLSDKLRSVFVPYFKYLLNGCVQVLMSGADAHKPKKKKKKHSVDLSAGSSEWHLRQLVLSALHKCFLYDTVGFLDTARFEQLLEPIVTQICADPTSSLSTTDQVPTVEEMDDTIVACLVQMALTAGSDLLWKPLNHQVLMSTRHHSERSRLLGLRVVKLLAEKLKEEYLVLLPETIPFLAELLADEELTVVAKTQELVKLLEELSGEKLEQYF
ncbi:hypothetical protein R1sor_020545 [Riccia sorocarpa]|uniref:BP28 C-terminal domain-containing protein n=1 Tax=Riccia sorocarpa TaxID=122646 RepID=A0ABD3IFK6_9MARC